MTSQKSRAKSVARNVRSLLGSIANGKDLIPVERYTEAMAEEGRKKFKTREKAIGNQSSSLFDQDGVVSNPDDLIESRGGLEIYDEMRRDDAIGAFMQFRKWARLASGWKIAPASEDREDLRAAAFVEFALGRFLSDPDFRTVLTELMTAYDYGYSVAEKVWARVSEGDWKGKWAFSRIAPKRPHAFEFAIDEVGRLKDEGGVINLRGFGDRVPMDRNDFVLYPYASEFGNPYGSSDLRRTHTFWVMKKHLIRFQAIYFERLAGGFFDVGYDPEKLGDETELDDMEEALESITIVSSLLHSDAFNVEIMESTGRGALSYEKAIQTMNSYCARTVFIPDLIGLSTKASGGSYAMARKHHDVFLWVLEAMGADLEGPVVGAQIIKPLIELNFGRRYALPHFKFKPMSHEERIKIVTTFVTAVEKGVLTPTEEDAKWVRALLEAPDEDRKDGEGKKKAPDADIPSAEDERGAGQQRRRDGGPEREEEPPVDFIEYNALRRRLKSYEHGTNFSLIEDVLDSIEEYAADRWKRIALDQHDNIIKAVRSRKLIERADYNGVEKLQLRKTGEIKALLENSLVTGYVDAKYQAWREGRDRVEKHAFELERYAGEVLKEPVKPKEAIDFFKKKKLAVTYKEIYPYRAIAYRIAGVESKRLLAEAKAIVTRGIRKGDSIWTEQQLKNLFDRYIETGRLTKEGLPAKAYHIETVVRTNMSEAYNQGRLSAFHHEDLRDEIEGYWYSAVLDDATTPYCEWMDENSPFTKAEFEKEGPPPAHYQCRSTFGVIVRGETWKPNRLRPPADATRQEGFTYTGGCRCHTRITTLAV